MATSNSTSPLSAAQRTSAKIILFAQSLSVISAGLGLIGLIVAYKVLISDGSTTTKGTTTRVADHHVTEGLHLLADVQFR